MPGAGKSTAASFFRKQRVPVIRMGDATDEELALRGLARTEEDERLVRNFLRNVHGDDIYAKYATGKIHEFFPDSPLVVVEGMRSIAEYRYLSRIFTRVKIIWIEAEKTMRYERLAHRKVRPIGKKQAGARDKWEQEFVDVRKLREKAAVVIVNDATKKQFSRQLGVILKEFTL